MSPVPPIHDAADRGQSFSGGDLPGELVGVLAYSREALSGFVERRHDPVELALASGSQGRQLGDVVCR